MLNALLSEADHGLVIGIIFTIVLGALLFIETPRQRRAVSVRAKLDSVEARATALEEAAVQRMMNQVKSALEAAEKKRMVRVKSGPLVPDAFVEPPHTRRAPYLMMRPLAVHRMLTHTGAAHREALEDWNQ
jgi:hypothetical protein